MEPTCYENFLSLAEKLKTPREQLIRDLLITEDTLERWKAPGVYPSKLFAQNMSIYVAAEYGVRINEKLEIIG